MKVLCDLGFPGLGEDHGRTRDLGISAAICLPLRRLHSEENDPTESEPRTVGVLYLDSDRLLVNPNGLTRRGLEALAAQAAVAIENNYLFQEMRKTEIEKHEYHVAAKIQQMLLPQRKQIQNGYEFAGRSIPCREMGGDFFDFFPLPDDRVGFVLADVAGKGLPAALLATLTQGIFTSQARGGDSPSLVLENVNDVLFTRGMESRFITLFYGIVDADGSLICSSAGHIPPVILRENGSVERLERGGIPLGIYPGREYEEEVSRLDPGDRLVLYSDGIPEAFNRCHDFLGESRLLELLRQERTQDVTVLVELIVGFVEDFACDHEQSDDITVMVIRSIGA
jgi:sigma-B regulation protein RsbU (phosphoserine phosphatase)